MSHLLLGQPGPLNPADSTLTPIPTTAQVTLTTLGVYVSVDKNNVLDAEKAFVSVSLFNILKIPLNMLPQLISNLAQVSLGRAGVLVEFGQVEGGI